VLQVGFPLDSIAQWMTVADTFIAAGGERNLVIGAFLNDADQTRGDVAPWNSALSYYFLDGVFVERVYFPPLAVSDTVEAPLMTSVFADVLNNDSDFDGGLVVDSLRIVEEPLFGTASVVPGTGEIQYVGDPGFLGQDTLTYRICDDEGLCDTAQVVFRVTGNLDDPLAVDDSTSTAWREPVVLMILANDLAGTYPLDPASVSILGLSPESGSLVWTASTQELLFTPSTDFCGTARFAYRLCDEAGTCDTADVAIAVLCPASICRTDDATLDGGDSTAINPLLNDTPGSGQWDVSTLEILTEPDAGSWFLRNDELVFEAPMLTSVQTLRYRACDEAGRCDEAEIIFRVMADPGVSPPTTLLVPDVITPNGDGFNDRWVIPDLSGFAEHDLRIINRWDSEVYRSHSYKNDWDGARLPDGTYFYVIRVVEQDGRTSFYSGDLTLLR
jgi:gliding motility-associated-like protein